MAYRDERGRITLDENAAHQDMQRLMQAKTTLEDAKKMLENLINQASGEQGQTADAVVEKATELKNRLTTLINRLTETRSFISNTVNHYKEVDRLVKEAVQATIHVVGTANDTVSKDN